MSQLNPNAAEFVPVSPTRSIPSPACRALINDPVIAQSPKRPSDIDINLPNPQEFENEVKSRPSDFDSYSNGHDNEEDHKSTSQELMENLLNGKNIDDIPEFQPGTTPTKVPSSEEFHFGPNASPFTPSKQSDQSETTLSTKAVFGDESTATFDSTFESSAVSKDDIDFTAKAKEEDPMSMSFYQEKTSDSFDLNKVQLLPENLDDFLSKPEDHHHDDTLSSNQPQQLVSDEILLNNDERIQTTDLDKVMDDEKELASPVSNEEDLISGTCELSRSPNPPDTGDFIDISECDLPKEEAASLQVVEACSRPESRSPLSDLLGDVLRVESKSPKPAEEHVADTPEPEMSRSPLLESVSPAPAPAPLSPEPASAHLLSSEQTKSPEPEIVSPAPRAATPEPQVSSPEPQPPSPEPQSRPILSPELEISSPEPGAESPLTKISSPEARSEELCQLARSPVPQALSPQPTEEVCLASKSPEPERIASSPPPAPLVDVEPEETVRGQVDDEVCKAEVEEKREVSVESPLEDVTSSVKDVSSPIQSPLPDAEQPSQVQQLNFAQEMNTPLHQGTVITVETSSSPIVEEEEIAAPPKDDQCPFSTPRSDAESVLTADMNSFLERSQISDLASPFSPGDQLLDADHPLMKCVYPLPTTAIKTETITPEFAEATTVLSPTEESAKEPEAPIAEAAAAVEEKKPAAKAKAAIKKTSPRPPMTASKAAASPTKARAATASAAPKARPSPAASKTAPTAKAPVTKAIPKPRSTAAAATASRLAAERKPLANGEVKATAAAGRVGATAKRPLESPKTATARTAAAASKTSPGKPAAARPTTAPARSLAVTKSSTTTTATTRARPNTLTKTSSSTTATSRTTTLSSTSTASRVTASKTTTSPKTTSPPKPRPTTAPAKPKAPITRTLNKTSVDAEKQHKESANKLTASRTVTSSARSTSATATKTSTLRKIESKTSTTGTTRTSVTKTTSTTTTRPGMAGKKPAEITRTANKTKTTKVEKPIQNGVSTVVTEQITMVNNVVNESDQQLMKDNSPIDNKLIVETNAAD